MNSTVYERTDINCCRLGVQEYYKQSCFITNRVVIVTNLWQCLSHRHDIDTAHNNICSFYITRT